MLQPRLDLTRPDLERADRDHMAIAVALGAIAERRIDRLVNRHVSELPPFLVEGSGLNSGFMIPQVTAAALVSENKQRAYPASVDSIPTSANQEDHVSMAAHGARRLILKRVDVAHGIHHQVGKRCRSAAAWMASSSSSGSFNFLATSTA